MKIYISSTFEDLKEHREKVYRQLRKMSLNVLSMEDYVAGDQRPLDKCLADVASCDVYVGIFAWRYGFIPKKDNPKKLSITELEYREAIRNKKQCLIFLLDTTVPWPPGFMDSHTTGSDGGKNINRLRSYLMEEHLFSWFMNVDQLASDVSAAVFQLQFKLQLSPPPSVASVTPGTAKDPDEPRQGTNKEEVPTAREGYPKLWQPGTVLQATFIDGSRRQKDYVRRFAGIWSAYANIFFQFTEEDHAAIRISFKQEGSWSYLGTDALSVPPGSPTMNFGWLVDKTPVSEADFIVLHEFGRVLGLQNEHQNPAGKIPWDKNAVYNDLMGPPNNWSRQVVDQNIFAHWDKNMYPFPKPSDPQSLMAYPLQSHFFTVKSFKFGATGNLSQPDKEFIAKLYPFS